MPSRVLLDTHVLVWLAFADQSLGPRSRSLVDNATKDESVFVSAISFFEIATLCRRGRLRLYEEVAAWRQRVLHRSILEEPVTGQIGILAGGLAGLPGDPADRIIAATAMVRDATLVTADQRILDWPGAVQRHDARR